MEKPKNVKATNVILNVSTVAGALCAGVGTYNLIINQPIMGGVLLAIGVTTVVADLIMKRIFNRNTNDNVEAAGTKEPLKIEEPVQKLLLPAKTK